MLQAVKHTNNGVLKKVSSALTLEAYTHATNFIKEEVKGKCEEWRAQISAFQVFYDEL